MDSKPNSLQPFMTKVGVGKTSSKNLTREEARAAMEALLRGEFHPVTFGAFFMALRYKTETAEEVAGFLDAMYAAQQWATEAALGPDAAAAPEGLLACAGAYNGKARTLNISLAAALVTAAAGVPVVLHGARGIPTKFGLTTSHLLEALGIHPRPALAQALHCLHTAGIAYVDQAELNPAFHALLPSRLPLGKRTILNTMEILSNPFGARRLVTGFFHDPYATLMGEALAHDGLPMERATVVKGIEGSDELRPGGMFMTEVSDGAFALTSINSDDLGLPHHISQLNGRADTLDEQIKLSLDALTELLHNPAKETGYRNSVILNAALRLTTAGKTPDIKAGITQAKEALNANAHREILERWRTACGA